MQTATQPLNNVTFTAYKYLFLEYPMHLQILSVNKRLRNFGRIQLIAKSSSIYVHKNLFAPHATDLLQKMAESLLSNFPRKRILLKLKTKKIIMKN